MCSMNSIGEYRTQGEEFCFVQTWMKGPKQKMWHMRTSSGQCFVCLSLWQMLCHLKRMFLHRHPFKNICVFWQKIYIFFYTTLQVYMVYFLIEWKCITCSILGFYLINTRCRFMWLFLSGNRLNCMKISCMHDI